MQPPRIMSTQCNRSLFFTSLLPFYLAAGREVVVGIVEVLDGLGNVVTVEVGLVSVELLAENLHNAEQVLQEQLLVLKNLAPVLAGALRIHLHDARHALADLADVLAAGVHGDVAGLELQAHGLVGRHGLLLQHVVEGLQELLVDAQLLAEHLRAALALNVAIGLAVEQQVGDDDGDDDTQDGREHLEPQVGLREQPEHHGHSHRHKAEGDGDIGITEFCFHTSYIFSSFFFISCR